MATKRIDYFDNLKGLLIFLVVLGHFLSYLPDVANSRFLGSSLVFIYAFHMPVFIFVSGLFAAKTCTVEKGFKGENVLFYLALYLIFILLNALEGLAFSGVFMLRPLTQEGAPWYLLAMTIFTLATPLLRRIRPAVMMPLLLVAAVVGLYCINGDTRGFLSSARVFAYAPCFAAGFYIGAGNMAELVQRVQAHPRFYLMRVLAVVVLAAFFLALYFMPVEIRTFIKRLSTGLNTVGVLAHWIPAPLPFYALARLLFYVGVAVLGMCIMTVTPSRKCFLTRWGERSLQVYIVHMLLIYILANLGLNEFMLGVTPLWKWSPFPLAVIVTALLSLPKAPLAWTAALKRLCVKAVNPTCLASAPSQKAR